MDGKGTDQNQWDEHLEGDFDLCMVLPSCHAPTTNHLRLGDMFQGLVYNLKHDRKKTEELASVGRMIPVEEMVLPDKVTDLPVPQAVRWRAHRQAE